jgi:hypothetical protein
MKSGRVKVEMDKRGQGENSECFSRILPQSQRKGETLKRKRRKRKRPKIAQNFLQSKEVRGLNLIKR